MEGLEDLVSQSLTRNGFDALIDHRRLQWSKWFRLESSFSLLLLPSKAGLFALAEEVIAAGELSSTGGKRVLAVFQFSESDDLGLGIGQLFRPGNPHRERLATGRVFARFAIMEDAKQRKSALSALH